MIESNRLAAGYRSGCGELTENTPEDRERARKTAARHATDANDLRTLLDMLGLRGRP